MKHAYPSYRNSGVDWLGDVPAHWDVRQLGTAMAETVGGGTPSTTNDAYWSDEGDEGVSWVAIADMSHGGDIAATEKRVTALGCSAARLRLLPPETVIYSMYASVGVAARLAITATTNQAILGLLPREELQTRFLYWYLTGIQSSVLSLTRDNTQSNLNAETVRKFPVLLPPVDEQRAIAEYLDGETEKIDTLVAKKRLLLERLAEYRKALITRAVTRGLPPEVALAAGFDPSPPLKPSGVEWLGDVPDHWNICQLRHILSEPLAYGANEAADIDDPGYPRYVRITDIDDLGFLKPDTFRSLPPEIAAPYLLREGDLLLARSGSVGKAFLYREAWGRCAYAGYLIRARFDEHKVCSIFMKYFAEASSFSQWLGSTVIQATIQNVSADRYAAMRLPVPPVDEQRAIAEFLDERTGRIDRLCSKVEEAIERLHEYRTALVTAAVTGKIDVRDVPTVKARSVNT